MNIHLEIYLCTYRFHKNDVSQRADEDDGNVIDEDEEKRHRCLSQINTDH